MPPVVAGAIRSSSSIGAVFLAQEPECLADIPTFARERAALAADVCAMPAFSTGDVENCGDEETVQGAAVGYARAAARRPPGGEKERETAGPLPAAGEAAPAGRSGRPVAASHAQRDGATPAVVVPAEAVPEVNPVRAAPPDNAVLIDTGKRGATLSATPGQQAGRGRTGQGQGKGRKKSASVAEDAPLPVTFTAAGQALWDAWASIFKTAPAPTKADTLAANDLAPKIAVWAVELSLSRKDVLNKIRGWLWAKDRQRGYYRERGVYLFDLAREFGGWQEAAERKLEEHALLTAPPRGRQQTSVVTPEMLAAARAAREAGKSVQVIDVNGKLEVIAR